MRVSIVLLESPRQYAPATDCSFSAPMLAVLGACGPRHRSVNGPFVYSDTLCSSCPLARAPVMRSSISSTL